MADRRPPMPVELRMHLLYELFQSGKMGKGPSGRIHWMWKEGCDDQTVAAKLGLCDRQVRAFRSPRGLVEYYIGPHTKKKRKPVEAPAPVPVVAQPVVAAPPPPPPTVEQQIAALQATVNALVQGLGGLS
jgi:hypothetical protein